MNTSLSNPPGAFPRRSFLLFILLAPAGILFICAIILATQYKQFKMAVSPIADVQKFAWNDSADIRLDGLSVKFHTFIAGDASRFKSDSLWISPDDLNLILAASPVATSQGIRFQIDIKDTLMIVRSTQPVESMRNRFAWIFKLVARHSGYLNARLEGVPELKDGKLAFAPFYGFLNGQKVPAIALVKRGGMSPLDFMNNHDFYDEFVQVLAEVKVAQGKILFVRKR